MESQAHDENAKPVPPKPVEAPKPADAADARMKFDERARRRKAAKAITLLVLATFLILFVVQNSQPAPVDFVFFTRHPRLIWVMFGCSVAGGIIGFFIGRPGRVLPFHRSDEKKD